MLLLLLNYWRLLPLSCSDNRLSYIRICNILIILLLLPWSLILGCLRLNNCLRFLILLLLRLFWFVLNWWFLLNLLLSSRRTLLFHFCITHLFFICLILIFIKWRLHILSGISLNYWLLLFLINKIRFLIFVFIFLFSLTWCTWIHGHSQIRFLRNL